MSSSHLLQDYKSSIGSNTYVSMFIFMYEYTKLKNNFQSFQMRPILCVICSFSLSVRVPT